MSREGIKSQLAPQSAAVDQSRAAYQLRVSQLDDLRVKSSMHGVLQQVPGRSRCAGRSWNEPRARCGSDQAEGGSPHRGNADERHPYRTGGGSRHDGTASSRDASRGSIRRATGGTVGVDITLLEALPPGARPDLSVDGTITLEKLDDVLFVGRPAFGQEHSTVMLFKLIGDTGEAQRVQVKLGRSSVNQIEITEGLQPGDQVILSDMSAQDSYDRIRLN